MHRRTEQHDRHRRRRRPRCLLRQPVCRELLRRARHSPGPQRPRLRRGAGRRFWRWAEPHCSLGVSGGINNKSRPAHENSNYETPLAPWARPATRRATTSRSSRFTPAAQRSLRRRQGEVPQGNDQRGGPRRTHVAQGRRGDLGRSVLRTSRGIEADGGWRNRDQSSRDRLPASSLLPRRSDEPSLSCPHRGQL